MGKKRDSSAKKGISRKKYGKELGELEIGLCKLQAWVKSSGARVVVVFEGRDTAGKGGVIKAITGRVSPRVFRSVALPAPNDRERSQFYFQRYSAHLPSAGEVILFDRSWYNRAGVEKVMGFCSDEEYEEFFRVCPEWEKALVRSGIILLKYFLVVGPEQQKERFEERINDPRKFWKLSPLDVKARSHWYDYSRAYDRMFEETDTEEAPWYLVESSCQKTARLNCIRHLLSMMPEGDVESPDVVLPELEDPEGFSDQDSLSKRTFIPDRY